MKSNLMQPSEQNQTKVNSNIKRNSAMILLILGPPIIIVFLYSYMMMLVAETDGKAPQKPTTAITASPTTD